LDSRYFESKYFNTQNELVDLAEYNLPFLGAELPAADQEEANAAIKAWSEKIASFYGYIFVTTEYNHAIGGALKNALDYFKCRSKQQSSWFCWIR
jgi:NAD(P)H-dependent FMN reductase